MNWREVMHPELTAVLCMEMQRGVLEGKGGLEPLAIAVEKQDVVANGAALLHTARQQGVTVIHCTAAFREDRRGSPVNTPLVASMLKNPAHMLEGSEAVDVIPAWYHANDLENRRYHGVAPFTATDLDSQLRALGVKTLIVMGVSLNLGVTGLCIEAANLGYQVIVVEDAVAGFPDDYAQAVLNNTLSLIAKRMSSADVIGAWR